MSSGELRHKVVIELADLIGRTTGAVSHRFANISNLIHGGTHGETHVSDRTRELFEKYLGNEDELHARAAEIRRRFLAEDSTHRVETEVPKDSVKQLTLDIFAAAGDAGLPDGSLSEYEREGTWHLGLIVNLAVALAGYSEQTTRFLLWLKDKLGEQFSRSRGFDLAVNGAWQEVADLVVARNAPALHASELRPSDRITVALKLADGGTLKGWKPTKKHLAELAKMNREGERKRIGEYLGIEAGGLCDQCLLMMKDFVDDSLEPD